MYAPTHPHTHTHAHTHMHTHTHTHTHTHRGIVLKDLVALDIAAKDLTNTQQGTLNMAKYREALGDAVAH